MRIETLDVGAFSYICLNVYTGSLSKDKGWLLVTLPFGIGTFRQGVNLSTMSTIILTIAKVPTKSNERGCK